jgi:hypothetical protein
MRAIDRGYQSGVVQSLLTTQNNSISNLKIPYHKMGIRAFLRALTNRGIILKYENLRPLKSCHTLYFKITNIVYGNFIYPVGDQFLNVEILLNKNWMELNVGKVNYLHNPLKKTWVRTVIPKNKSQYNLRLPIQKRPKFKKFGVYAAKVIKTAVRKDAVKYIPKIMES